MYPDIPSFSGRKPVSIGKTAGLCVWVETDGQDITARPDPQENPCMQKLVKTYENLKNRIIKP